MEQLRHGQERDAFPAHAVAVWGGTIDLETEMVTQIQTEGRMYLWLRISSKSDRVTSEVGLSDNIPLTIKTRELPPHRTFGCERSDDGVHMVLFSSHMPQNGN